MRTNLKVLLSIFPVAILISCGQQAENSDQQDNNAEAVNLEDFTSLQMTGVEQISVEVDLDGAVQRLSKAVTFPTISNQDRDDFDTKAFDDYHKFLEGSFIRFLTIWRI